MGKFIRLRKGFDIRLTGKAELKLANVDQPETFAIKPTDFQGLYMPKVVVKEGDTVKAGAPLFHDKKDDRIVFTAPVSGEVVEVRRGEKRKLLEIRVLADKEVEHVNFKRYSVSEIANLSREAVLEQLLRSGVWANIVQRPYGVIAQPNDTPKAIFISAFDSHPLSADYGFIFKNQDNFFQVGVDLLQKLTPGLVHVNVHAQREISSVFSQAKGIELNKFSGPHPCGCVGVQIHHIDPLKKGEVVWTINPYGVIQLGKLFLSGVYDTSRIIAVAGSEVKNPQYYKTYTGPCINKFIAENLKQDHVRYISGNVLTGERIPADGYLGFFDNILTIIPEGDSPDFFGWMKPTLNKPSFQRAIGLLSFLAPGKEFTVNSNTNGEPRAFVQTGIFEKVTPMDILPGYLLKAIIAEDYDGMEALGIYEVIEEDLALCEFVDVSKHDVQELLRDGIGLMQNS